MATKRVGTVSQETKLKLFAIAATLLAGSVKPSGSGEPLPDWLRLHAVQVGELAKALDAELAEWKP